MNTARAEGVRERKQWGGWLGGVPATTYLSQPPCTWDVLCHGARTQDMAPMVAGTNQKFPRCMASRGRGRECV